MFGGGTVGQKVVFDGTPNFIVGPNVASANAGTALLAEIIASFFLIFAVWGTAADPRARNVGGVAIGLTIAAGILSVGPLTRGRMKPARRLCPAFVGGGGPVRQHRGFRLRAPP